MTGVNNYKMEYSIHLRFISVSVFFDTQSSYTEVITCIMLPMYSVVSGGGIQDCKAMVEAVDVR